MRNETASSRAVPRFLDNSTPPHIVTLVLLAGMSALSINIFLPSVPGMSLYFDADYGVVQLAISAYLGLTGVLQLIIGPLSDRYGRRNVLLICFGVFVLATLGSIFAPTVEVFLVFRMIQAVVAAGTALSRAIVRDMVPASEAASMIGYVTMGMALVPMVGPMLGGVLEDWSDWRASFTALLVFGAIVWIILWFDLGETNKSQSGSFREQFRKYPELFRSRRFWGYSFLAGFATGSFFAFLGGAPYVATEVLGMSPTQIGVYFGFIPFGYLIGNFVSGRFSTQFGISRMTIAGSFFTAFGAALALLLFLAGYQTPFALFGSIFFVGIGNGLTLPSATAGLLSVRPEIAGTASGLGTAVLIGGGAVMSAITGMLLGPGSGAWPLILMMLLSSSIGIAFALYTSVIEREVAA